LTLRNSITVVADLQKDTIAKRWSAYYINNGVLQELLALLPVSSIRLLAVNPENIDSVVVIR